MTVGIDLKPLPQPTRASTESTDDDIVQFSNRLTRRHKRQLTTLAKRSFKPEHYHLELALDAHFARQDPALLVPITE